MGDKVDKMKATNATLSRKIEQKNQENRNENRKTRKNCHKNTSKLQNLILTTQCLCDKINLDNKLKNQNITKIEHKKEKRNDRKRFARRKRQNFRHAC